MNLQTTIKQQLRRHAAEPRHVLLTLLNENQSQIMAYRHSNCPLGAVWGWAPYVRSINFRLPEFRLARNLHDALSGLNPLAPALGANEIGYREYVGSVG